MRRIALLLFWVVSSQLLAATGGNDVATENRPAKGALRWPLNIEISPSSSFGEFRGMRFHGGVDLRTRQTTGFPVFAMADGFVSRMKVQHRGFGYALYVDYPSYNVRGVYGHLEDYGAPMAQYASDKLRKMNARYGIDDTFGPEKFPIKKDQIIAYTGESGLGPPHLHFELRTPGDEPISPTTLGMKVPDHIMPILMDVYFDPLAADSCINGSFLPFSQNLKKKSADTYSWSQAVRMSGKVGLQLGLVDPGEGGNRFGVETIQVNLDGKLIFQRQFHRYSYDENDQCPYIYDFFRSSRRGTGYVYTLFKWPFDTTRFSQDYKGWDGTLNSSMAGNHVLAFVATDFGGNIVSAEGPIVVEPSAPRKSSYRGQIVLKSLEYGRFNVVAVGEVLGNGKFDSVIVSDAKGAEQVLHAQFNSREVQIAFPMEAKWSEGAWCGKSMILPRLTFIDAKGGHLQGQDGSTVRFPAGSLPFPVLATFSRRLDLSGTKQLPAQSVGWEIQPADLLLEKPLQISIACQSTASPKQLAIYEPTGSGYSCEGGEAENGKVTTSGRAPGPMVVLADSIPPVVTYAGTRTIKHIGKCLVYNVKDIGEGFNYDSLQATISGEKSEPDSDPDKSEVYVPVPSKKAGKLEVHLTTRDKAGNIREINEKR